MVHKTNVVLPFSRPRQNEIETVLEKRGIVMKATTIAAMVLAAAAASAATIVALKKAHEKKQNARLEPMEGGDVTICTGDPIPAEDDDSDCCCEKTDTDAPKPEEADKED